MVRWAVLAVALGLTAGTPLAAQLPGIALDARTAGELGLSVGDTVRIGSAPDSITNRAVIAAIFRRPNDPATLMRQDRLARLHLPDLAGLLGAPDRVDRWGVVLRPGVDPATAADRLNQAAFGFRAHPSAVIAAESSRTFEVVSRFHRAIAIIAVAAGAVFLLCIMLLKVEERRLDTAVMRFVGVRRRTVIAVVVLEAALVALLGSAGGLGLAIVAAAATNAWYRAAFDTTLIFALVTPGVATFAVVLSVALGIGAGALAALRLATTHPLSLWRRG